MYVFLYYKDSSVYGPIVSRSPFFDHKLMEFNHLDECETLRRIHLDEMTLFSDNLGLSYLWVIQVLLTSAGVERSASKQHSRPGLHYPGGLRPSRFITSGIKMFVRFGLAPGFMVNTEIVSSNRRQTLRPVAQQLPTLCNYNRSSVSTVSIWCFYSTILENTVRRISKIFEGKAPRVIFDFTKIMHNSWGDTNGFYCKYNPTQRCFLRGQLIRLNPI